MSVRVSLSFPREVLFIMHRLQAAGWEAAVVGGAVRDLLRLAEQEQHPAAIDFDFTTNAKPEQILTLLPESFYENTFGTVSIAPKHLWELMGIDPENNIEINQNDHFAKNNVINLDQSTKLHPSLSAVNQSKPQDADVSSKNGRLLNYEITTYRAEGKYLDHRRPDNVTWGDTLEDDLSRRDFTINAMAIRIPLEVLNRQAAAGFAAAAVTLAPEEFEVVDPYHGLSDLDARVIRPVGDATTRFEEDALRMLRAIRFAVQLNFELAPETLPAIQSRADDLQHISWERVGGEVMKMLASPNPAGAIELLDQANLLEWILPELIACKHIRQGGHHTTDVWTHSLDALRTCPASDPVVRLATLLHDIAKPQTYAEQNGTISFYNHEIIGARVAKSIAQRLRLSKRDVDRVFLLVRYHMFYYQPENTDAAIRRFMRKVGLENINDILDLREADRLGSGARETSWRLEEMKARMVEQLHQPFAMNDLAVDGNDLMTELHLQPGPVLGMLLKTLFEKVLENPELNDRDTLLGIARELWEREKSSTKS